jgi:hypothetical protein
MNCARPAQHRKQWSKPECVAREETAQLLRLDELRKACTAAQTA